MFTVLLLVPFPVTSLPVSFVSFGAEPTGPQRRSQLRQRAPAIITLVVAALDVVLDAPEASRTGWPDRIWARQPARRRCEGSRNQPWWLGLPKEV